MTLGEIEYQQHPEAIFKGMNRRSAMKLLINTLTRLDTILNTQAAEDTDLGKTLCEIAKTWIGKGTYVEEDSNKVLVCNYPATPAYQVNDFMVLFSIFPKTNKFQTTMEYLQRLAQQRRSDKTLHMNCWQFVLLCMETSGKITPTDITRMYQTQNMLTNEERRIPNLMIQNGKRSQDQTLNEGDIIFFTKDKGLIWHMGIVYDHNGTMGYIHCLGYDVSFSEFNEYDKPFFCLSPTDVVENILQSARCVKTADFSFMSDIKPDEMLHALFDKDGELHQEYRDELNRRWKAHTSTEEYRAFEPDENFKDLLRLMGRGDQYDRERTEEYHKRTYQQSISTHIKKGILSTHGLDELLQEEPQ
jgi:hypothetical protein